VLAFDFLVAEITSGTCLKWTNLCIGYGVQVESIERNTRKGHIADMVIAQSPAVGERAPDFDLDAPHAGKITLKDLTAKRTLIILQRHLG
jgi:hypothetical protein